MVSERLLHSASLHDEMLTRPPVSFRIVTEKDCSVGSTSPWQAESRIATPRSRHDTTIRCGRWIPLARRGTLDTCTAWPIGNATDRQLCIGGYLLAASFAACHSVSRVPKWAGL